jgi:TetR/AcrR family transcriptional repressor of nem operon
MRVSKARAADNRRRILGAASRLFRERGIEGCGVDAITAAAGLTHGAFYSQFESKEAVVAEAVRLVLDGSRERLEKIARGKEPRRAFAAIVDAYLAPAHRDAPGRGCVMAALGPDIARQPLRVRRAFTRGVEDSVRGLAAIAPGMGGGRQGDDALPALSCMLGALILARTVSDEALSRRILAAAARLLRPARRRSAPRSAA